MDKLIVVEEDNKYKFNSFNSLVRKFICDDYYELSLEDRLLKLERLSISNCLNSIDIVYLKDRIYKEEYSNKFILYDEYTYILSLLRFDKIILLENIDAKIFIKDNVNDNGNYLVVNKYVDMLFRNYLR